MRGDFIFQRFTFECGNESAVCGRIEFSFVHVNRHCSVHSGGVEIPVNVGMEDGDIAVAANPFGLMLKFCKIQAVNDFDGAVKSLGAWGGDFFLAASEMPFERVSKYFQTKGLKTVFKFNDLKIDKGGLY